MLGPAVGLLVDLVLQVNTKLSRNTFLKLKAKGVGAKTG
jgi:hypothetical protein